MKKLIALLLTLMLLPLTALAFDSEELYSTENCEVTQDALTGETIVRPANQPYMGEMPEDGSMMVSIGYVEDLQTGLTLVQVVVAIEMFDMVEADTLVFNVGGKDYAFAADPESFEYDGIYMEDYTFCLTSESLPFLKALAQQKKDDPVPIAFVSLGETLATGQVVLPGEDCARLYDRYIDLGGKKQDLGGLEIRWPCEITKTK